MEKYINADKLKEKKIYSEERHEYIIPVAEVDWAPAIDVQEIKHAKWETVGNYKVECTNCHRIRDIKTQCGWNFCPTCGAKIDLED